jgi:hypothetical protein
LITGRVFTGQSPQKAGAQYLDSSFTRQLGSPALKLVLRATVGGHLRWKLVAFGDISARSFRPKRLRSDSPPRGLETEDPLRLTFPFGRSLCERLTLAALCRALGKFFEEAVAVRHM